MDPTIAQPIYSLPYTVFKFMTKFTNLIDLAAILPTYVEMIVVTSDSNLVILRLFRVVRLFRLLSFLKNANAAADLIKETMVQATTLLGVFLFFVIIIIIFFGFLIYLVESGTFTVNQDYPNGAYLRPTYDGTGMSVSPFKDIPIGIYWAISTASGSGEANYFYFLYV